LKENKKFNCPDTYEIVGHDFIQEIGSRGMILRHKKSGARVVLLQNDDDNKVFYISFRTPPKDSTGTAHIIEHTVMCGSEKYPLKDPFMELAKGSLNTFLNAITYADKTVYPVASCNDKDFQNLMDVYLDAVFHPNIYHEEKIFKQEGWHYELEHMDEDIIYNGVVYNEMKGVYSSPEDKIFSDIEKALFPESVYGLESGGSPEEIPQLDYEEFLDFHRKYYHPSNSYIYLYGNMDMEEKLNWMDAEYLSQYDMQQVDSEIKKQKPFSEPRHAESMYSVTEGTDCAGKTYLAYSMVAGDSLDREFYLAFQILEYVLLDRPGAPLREALFDAGIGHDILNHFDKEMLQPVFSIIAKGAEPEDANKFRNVIFDTLEKIVQDGIGETPLRAAINFFEFMYREADFGRYPKGLMYGLQILDSWLYDDEKPFLYLHTNAVFARLKGQVSTGYFEGLIRTWILENNHAVCLVMRPEPGLTEKQELLTAEHLKKYKLELSEDEIHKLIDDTAALKAYQQEPTAREDLEKIPVLAIEDIKREPEPIYNEEIAGFACPVIHHNIDTNGIGYFELLFDVTNMDLKLAPYAGFITALFGEMDTEHYTLAELSNELDIHTGDMDVDLYLYADAPPEDETGEDIQWKESFSVKAGVKVKAFYSEFDSALSLVEEILFHTKIKNEKRLKEILGEERSRLQMRMVNQAHNVAVKRAESYHSKLAAYHELIGGIDYYHQLNEWYENFDKEKNTMIQCFEKLIRQMFDAGKLIISLTSDQTGLESAKEPVTKFLKKISSNGVSVADGISDMPPVGEQISLKKKNEGFCTAGQVQYVARTGNFRKNGCNYHGAMHVLRIILSYDYLWTRIRVLGGAYDFVNGFARNGSSFFVSYRDPNLERTNQIFEEVWEYVQNFDADPLDMRKYIIGAISSMDIPLTPAAKGSRSMLAYLTGITFERLQKERDQVLHASVEDIRALASHLKNIMEDQELCVIGNTQAIKKNEDLFMEVKELV